MKTKVTSVALPAELHATYKAIAKEAGLSLSALVRLALEELQLEICATVTALPNALRHFKTHFKMSPIAIATAKKLDLSAEDGVLVWTMAGGTEHHLDKCDTHHLRVIMRHNRKPGAVLDDDDYLLVDEKGETVSQHYVRRRTAEVEPESVEEGTTDYGGMPTSQL